MNFLRSFISKAKYAIPSALALYHLSTFRCQRQSNTQQQIQTTVSNIFFSTQQCQFSDLKLFSIGASSLGRQISSHLDIALGRHETSRFNDGEISMQIHDSVSGHKVVILKTFENQSVNEGLMELLLAISTMKKNGATNVTVIFPYFPYTINVIDRSLQDENYDPHVHAPDIARMMQSCGCDTIITLNSPLDELRGFTGRTYCTAITVPYLVHRNISNPVLIGTRPIPSISKRIKGLGEAFQLFDIECDYGMYSSLSYVGEKVKDRDVVLFNNVLRSAKRLQLMTVDLKKQGANNIYIVGIHGISRQEDFTSIVSGLPIKQLILTNTIQSQFHVHIQNTQSKKIRCLSVGKYLAEVISILHKNKSLADFRNERDLLKYFFLQKIRRSKNPDAVGGGGGEEGIEDDDD